MPDCLSETFREGTDHGGHDAGSRSLRYLEWLWDPDPSDSTFRGDYVYLLRDEDGSTRTVHDVHEMGLFPRDTWLSLLGKAGYSPRSVQLPIGDEGENFEGFLALK
ncbi:MAG TPA: hypothetical protein VIE88_13285 [Vicinamibacteria bacterium]